MSLIDCAECKTPISDKAIACPKYGYPLNPPSGRPFSEKNIGQIAGATGIWLTAPWVARMVVGVVTVIVLGAVGIAYILR
ncbi:zinc ribbon domain-containing protein [Pseudomonas mangiferae]|uniref:Zinc ribbon domain-containing protein n=1 Tax=Pseudomonas mangiferae TaxID=2593654 RepID=A0A553H1M9_9PSED|nr:zinc ribbon domain-containing protein [Pseudomonas mangiferae]TRX75660.1 zinc ribbon domain-containing protein [Pseudomonas mangiferae]